jgi:hypothetical protein
MLKSLQNVSPADSVSSSTRMRPTLRRGPLTSQFVSGPSRKVLRFESSRAQLLGSRPSPSMRAGSMSSAEVSTYLNINKVPWGKLRLLFFSDCTYMPMSQYACNTTQLPLFSLKTQLKILPLFHPKKNRFLWFKPDFLAFARLFYGLNHIYLLSTNKTSFFSKIVETNVENRKTCTILCRTVHKDAN